MRYTNGTKGYQVFLASAHCIHTPADFCISTYPTIILCFHTAHFAFFTCIMYLLLENFPRMMWSVLYIYIIIALDCDYTLLLLNVLYLVHIFSAIPA
jgi:hypothetical protein